MRWNVVIGGQLFSKSFLGYTTYKMEFATREGLLPAVLLMMLPFADPAGCSCGCCRPGRTDGRRRRPPERRVVKPQGPGSSTPWPIAWKSWSRRWGCTSGVPASSSGWARSNGRPGQRSGRPGHAGAGAARDRGSHGRNSTRRTDAARPGRRLPGPRADRERDVASGAGSRAGPRLRSGLAGSGRPRGESGPGHERDVPRGRQLTDRLPADLGDGLAPGAAGPAHDLARRSSPSSPSG